MTDSKGKPVSPRNGNSVPRGKPFTSETAREAAQKSNESQKARRSILAAFKKDAAEMFHDKETGREMTGAEIISRSIIKGAMNGNAKMVEIALGLLGEKPAETLNVNMPDPGIAEEIRAFVEGHDN